MSIMFVVLITFGVLLWISEKINIPVDEEVLSRAREKNFEREEKIEEARLTLFLWTKSSYLRSTEWEAKREQALSRDNYKCASCSSPATEVHHMSDYGKIPLEPLTSLVSLCRYCHQLQHDVHGYPNTLEEYKEWDVKLITQQG